MTDFLGVIAPWIVAAISGFIGAALLLPTKLGEAVFNYRIDKALEGFKAEQSRELEQLKEQLNHLGDRGKRSNEREFAAIGVVWEKFVDAYQSTRQCVTQIISHPDLNRMSDDDVKAFLEAGELSEVQRKQVMLSEDKNKIYSKVVTFRMINKTAQDIYELRLLLRKNGIFIPIELRRATTEGIEILSTAESEAYMRHQFPDHGVPFEGSMKFSKDGDSIFEALMETTRARLHREDAAIR